jgi:hypothetical protein
LANTSTNKLARGFKSKAEKLSVEYRQKLGLQANALLSAFALAAYLEVNVYTPQAFGLDSRDLQNILGSADRDSGWSALTMDTQKGNRIIIHNDCHVPVRQQSNLMHELAHIICNHKQVSNHTGLNLPMSMREFDPIQEEEATILGSALIIPREGLISLLRKNWSHPAIGNHYNASAEMVQFRINATGAERQMSYGRQARR